MRLPVSNGGCTRKHAEDPVWRCGSIIAERAGEIPEQDEGYAEEHDEPEAADEIKQGGVGAGAGE